MSAASAARRVVSELERGMGPRDDLEGWLRRACRRGHRPHQVLGLVVELEARSRALGVDGEERRQLLAALGADVPGLDFEVLRGQAHEYACHLALSPGRLLYEEVSRLASSCQEFWALGELGLAPDVAREQELREALRARHRLQPGDVHDAVQRADGAKSPFVAWCGLSGRDQVG